MTQIRILCLKFIEFKRKMKGKRKEKEKMEGNDLQ